LYKKWIRDSVGNVFENVLGVFFGNVPHNFTTSHVFIHHRVDGGPGDTFYEWDLDRTNLSEFMLYITRISKHMVGYSSLKLFHALNQTTKYDKLMQGVVAYWSFAAVLLAVTRSFSFVFWIYLQPLMCMTYFLALLNYGFHGFLEFDAEGKNISVIDATTIIDGEDDYFGEDDHMAHHYHTNVYFRDLPAHQQSKLDEFKKYKGSVFKGCSILELSIFLLFSLWDELAKHYVDYTGEMTKEDIKAMLKARAKRKQISHERYEEYVKNPTQDARKELLSDIQDFIQVKGVMNKSDGVKIAVPEKNIDASRFEPNFENEKSG
jgi:fatty acid desaturase